MRQEILGEILTMLFISGPSEKNGEILFVSECI